MADVGANDSPARTRTMEVREWNAELAGQLAGHRGGPSSIRARSTFAVLGRSWWVHLAGRRGLRCLWSCGRESVAALDNHSRDHRTEVGCTAFVDDDVAEDTVLLGLVDDRCLVCLHFDQ